MDSRNQDREALAAVWIILRSPDGIQPKRYQELGNRNIDDVFLANKDLIKAYPELLHQVIEAARNKTAEQAYHYANLVRFLITDCGADPTANVQGRNALSFANEVDYEKGIYANGFVADMKFALAELPAEQNKAMLQRADDIVITLKPPIKGEANVVQQRQSLPIEPVQQPAQAIAPTKAMDSKKVLDDFEKMSKKYQSTSLVNVILGMFADDKKYKHLVGQVNQLLNSDSPEIRGRANYLLSRAYLSANDNKQATEKFEAAIRNQDPQALLRRAKSILDNKKLDPNESVQSFKELLNKKAEPGSRDYAYQQQAVKLLEKQKSLLKNNPELQNLVEMKTPQQDKPGLIQRIRNNF